ncbi:MAG: hypothetical protein ACT4PV_07245 [Planctomycetaceae bacterium]
MRPLLGLLLLACADGDAARVETLKRLFLEDRITPEQVKEGRALLEAPEEGMGEAERKRRKIYVDLADGRLPAEYLDAVLRHLAASPPAQSARVLELLALARAKHRPESAGEALAALAELLALDPTHEEAITLSLELRAYAQASDPSWWIDRALGEARSMDPGEARDLALAWAAGLKARAGDPAAGDGIATEIALRGPAASARRTIALALARSGDEEGARAYALRVADPAERAQTLLALAGEGAAFRQMQEAAEALAAGEGFRQGRFLVDLALAKAASGDAAGARGTIGELADGALRAEAYAGAAIALARRGDLAAAKAFINLPSDANWRYLAYAVLAAEQARAGDRSGALATAESIVPSDHQVSAFLGIARARIDAGDAAGARDSLTRLEKGIGHMRVARQAVAAYAALAEARAALGDLAAARDAWERGSSVAASLTGEAADGARIVLAQGRAALGDAEAAIAMLGSVNDPLANLLAYRGLGGALARSGKRAAAVAWVAALSSPGARAGLALGIASASLEEPAR